MKIVFIGGRDIHKLGGIENYMYNLATQLVIQGHEPIVFCESDHNAEEFVNGFRVIYRKGPQSRYLCKIVLGIKATIYTIRNIRGVDIIHYNTWSPAVLGMLIAKLFRRKALIMGHGHGWQRTKYTPFQQKLMKLMEYVGVRMAKYRIMCSEAQTQYFMEKHGLNSITVPTAITIPNLNMNSTSNILEVYDLKENRYFIYLARLVQDKNPDYLVRAFDNANIAGFKLVIAGNNDADPKYVDYLHALAEGNSNIVFTGAVYDADKDMLLRSAYAYCIPSTIEGLSISLLEAMSYKLPIIASNIPANREVLDIDKAIWVEVEDVQDLVSALNRSISDSVQFKGTVDYNYKKVVNGYTWNIITRKYIAAINTFLNNEVNNY